MSSRPIPTEPIGSIPRPHELLQAINDGNALSEEVCDRVLEAAQYIPLEQLGTTDDCGFSPFCDDVSTTRDTAFAKIRARVLGTALAAKRL